MYPYTCLQSFPLQLQGFDNATREYQSAEYWQLTFLSLLAIVQGACVWGGLVSV